MDGDGGTSLTVADRMDPARAAALHATLGLPGRPAASGDVLPPFFHHIYFWDARPPQDLGADGHPRTGRLIPDLGLPRRMWAGGRLTFHAPLRAGVLAERTTTLAGFTRKTGRTGQLGLVTLRHVIRQKGMPAVTEEQDLVYREAARQSEPAPTPPNAPSGEETRDSLSFDTTALFRYSALTFNGHRIHYDADYARSEGYRDLVVHGPLLAQWLMLLAAQKLGALSGFAFRATSPVHRGETVDLCSLGPRFWVRGQDGRLCMDAKAN
jgi:3-methylfumaryl-CoA hydratase